VDGGATDEGAGDRCTIRGEVEESRSLAALGMTISFSSFVRASGMTVYSQQARRFL